MHWLSVTYKQKISTWSTLLLDGFRPGKNP